ncbi:unnamed protein product [Penicillium manginii]
MTFLLNTNPETRSVKLLGSWDNFTKQYVMNRDKRVGAGHWKGCHTFTDIMGDGPSGSLGEQSQWRTGGLKMGATYWYYYLLDDDIESINENEPVTTKCPLLPGQPVNVLNVPIVLPDSRSHGRTGSNSSQKADYRTMNPKDKFMNPRKPPQPVPARLQTAMPRKQPPAVHSQSTSPIHGMVHRSASQPGSARGFHSKDARSASPPRARALLAALRPANETEGQGQISPLPRSKTVNGVLRHDGSTSDRRKVPEINVNTGAASPVANIPEFSTIQSRRALKAKGGDAPALNLLTVQTRPQPRKPSPSRGAAAGNNLGTVDETRALKDALEFIASNPGSDQTTPTGKDVNDKRLPTLPNTPSSVMDEAVREIDDHDRVMDSEVPHSHFSIMTATTADDTTHSRFIPEQSRFSEWSTDTDTEAEDNSPESMISTSTFNQDTNESPAVDDWRTPELSQSNDAMTNTDPNTPHLTVHSKPSSPNSASGELPPWNDCLPELAISLASPGLQGSGLGIDQMDEVESNPKRHAALFSAIESMEALSLSRRSPDGSPIILPERESQQHRDALDRVRSRSRSRDGSSQGKRTMQELMDELSYLKNMIQSDMDGEPF